MSFDVLNLLIVGGLFVAMLVAQRYGRRLKERHLRLDPTDTDGSGAAEAAIFGLLGLFLAFTFSGSGTRFDQRRHLIVEEANAIGTAWLRIDVLPEPDRAHLRELFRQYLDARLETYRDVRDPPAVAAARAKTAAVQEQIWQAAVTAAHASRQMPPFTVLMPALNEMFDTATMRMAVTRMHAPVTVFVVIGILSIMASVLTGYALAKRRTRRLQGIGFATVLAVTLYVIVDFEFPRVGLIRVDTMDQVLIDLRRSMK